LNSGAKDEGRQALVNGDEQGNPRLPEGEWSVAICAAAIAAADVGAYAGTLRVQLFFDDLLAIKDNPTIRHLGDIRAVLWPAAHLPRAIGVSSRPIVNLSLAINYALGGLAVAPLEKAVQMDPGNTDAHVSLGSALLAAKGHRNEAAEQYAVAARLRPGDATIHYDPSLRPVGPPGEAG
jgi:hypothetical protein